MSDAKNTIQVWNISVIGQNRLGVDVCNLYRDRELMGEYLFQPEADAIVAKLNAHADLLAALESIVSADGKEWRNLSVGPDSTLEQARAAIAKAK